MTWNKLDDETLRPQFIAPFDRCWLYVLAGVRYCPYNAGSLPRVGEAMAQGKADEKLYWKVLRWGLIGTKKEGRGLYRAPF